MSLGDPWLVAIYLSHPFAWRPLPRADEWVDHSYLARRWELSQASTIANVLFFFHRRVWQNSAVDLKVPASVKGLDSTAQGSV